jgi:hypothetical protein
MRLREADKRTVTVKSLLGDDEVYRWGEGRALRAVIQPVSDQVSVQRYGERISRMRMLFAERGSGLCVGMGVCVTVAPDASCDYRVIAVEDWDHTRATLEWIPEGSRG